MASRSHSSRRLGFSSGDSSDDGIEEYVSPRKIPRLEEVCTPPPVGATVTVRSTVHKVSGQPTAPAPATASTSTAGQAEDRFEFLARELANIKGMLAQTSQARDTTFHSGLTPTERTVATPVLDDLVPPVPPPIEPSAPELDIPVTVIAEATKQADPLRLLTVDALQHFNNPDWANVRYAETQKKYLAAPAFTYLELNDELAPFESKPFLHRSIDQTFGVLTNMLLAQREAVQAAVKDILALPGAPPELHSKLSAAFAAGSSFAEISKDLLQVVCGRRAAVIEQRRDQALSGVRDRFNKAALRRIPPSRSHLFQKEQFADAISKMGGAAKVLKRPYEPAEGRYYTSMRRAPAFSPTRTFRAHTGGAGAATSARARAPPAPPRTKPAGRGMRRTAERSRPNRRRDDHSRR